MAMPDIRLYALVDADNLGPDALPQLARQAAENGATLIQYRDKSASTRQMVDRARAIRAALAGTQVPLLINDRLDVALAAGADGIHIGREDLSPADARRIAGPDMIIGLTVKNQSDADLAAVADIDYACIGGVFATISKQNPDIPVGIDGFKTLATLIRAAQPGLPIGAIAGIDEATAPTIITAGADGVAVISAIFRTEDCGEATARLRSVIDTALDERQRS